MTCIIQLGQDETQDTTILKHLLKYGTITSIQSIRLYGITRLAAIIPRLVRKGHNITSELQFKPENKSVHYSLYTLKK